MIWKFALKLLDHQTLILPKGSHILSVGYQPQTPRPTDDIQLWAWVPPGTDAYWKEQLRSEERKIAILGTGHPSPRPFDEVTFLGTVLMANGALAWHVFLDGER